MHPCEQAVRDAAANLQTVIAEAEAVGFRVDFPKRLLDGIPISETAKFVSPVVEMVIDTRGAVAASAAFTKAMKTAQAAVDKVTDAETSILDPKE